MTEATIIVVTYNSARWLERQAAALAAQTETSWRLVVVDNASEDERPDTRAFPFDVEIIQNERNVGFAEANNIAALDRQTPYLIFLNPDAFPEPGWLAALLQAAKEHPEAVAIGSTQVRHGTPDILDGTGDVLHSTGFAYRSNHGKRGATGPLAETFSACGAAMLVRREAFEAIGGFDGRYFCYFEDVDLGFRLRLAGGRVLQAPDAIVAHVGGGSAGARSEFAEFHGARNRLWTFFKCMPMPLLALLAPLHLAGSILLVSAAPFRGRGFGAWRGFVAGLTGLRPILETRRELQNARKASLSDIAAALAWAPDVFFTRRAVHRKIRG
ncbi:MAG: glycosyltransferase family 2 protein [Hyphomonadaceae bacterium]